jgi:hypothetical protein
MNNHVLRQRGSRVGRSRLNTSLAPPAAFSMNAWLSLSVFFEESRQRRAARQASFATDQSQVNMLPHHIAAIRENATGSAARPASATREVIIRPEKYLGDGQCLSMLVRNKDPFTPPLDEQPAQRRAAGKAARAARKGDVDTRPRLTTGVWNRAGHAHRPHSVASAMVIGPLEDLANTQAWRLCPITSAARRRQELRQRQAAGQTSAPLVERRGNRIPVLPTVLNNPARTHRRPSAGSRVVGVGPCQNLGKRQRHSLDRRPVCMHVRPSVGLLHAPVRLAQCKLLPLAVCTKVRPSVGLLFAPVCLARCNLLCLVLGHSRLSLPGAIGPDALSMLPRPLWDRPRRTLGLPPRVDLLERERGDLRLARRAGRREPTPAPRAPASSQ